MAKISLYSIWYFQLVYVPLLVQTLKLKIMENVKTKYESRNTVVKAKGIYGAVHCSVCYCNDEPNTICFTQHRTSIRTVRV